MVEVRELLRDPERARSMGLISAKAQLTTGVADWPTYLGLLAQGAAVGGALLFSFLATLVWSAPATSYAATCPAAHCDFFVSECLSSGGSSFSYNVLGTCTFGLDTHSLFEFVCRYNNGQGSWSEMCWDD